MYIACIDTGTTNTRVCIRNENQIFSVSKHPAGVRTTSINGNNSELLKGIKLAYVEALNKAKITENEISCILASGMITSNLGVLEVPHVIAPATASKLADNIVTKKIPQISSSLPIHFIPGVKNAISNIELTLNDIPSMDIMRGEEVETFGALDKEKISGPAILILPGSHTKIVYVDENNAIQACATTMAGETIMQFTTSTIISDALESSYVDSIDIEYLKAGAYSCRKSGLTRSAFLVRILQQFSNATCNQRKNFLLGAVIQEDIKCIFNNHAFSADNNCKILVCGSSAFGKGCYSLLKDIDDTKNRTYLASEETMNMLASYGAILIAKKANII